MGVKERRERERTEIRTLILDAARELFTTEGYEAVTMRKIAEKIEYSPTAIYSHFEDKETLLRELCSTDFLALARILTRIAEVRDPFERLAQIGKAYVRFAIENPQHYRLMFMTPLPEIPHHETQVKKGDPTQDSYAFLLATVEECITTGRMRPEYTDPHMVSQVAWAGVHGVAALHIAMACSNQWVEWRPAPDTGDLLVDTLIRGMQKK